MTTRFSWIMKVIKSDNRNRTKLVPMLRIFAAVDMNGNSYSLGILKGKVVVINFWFVECKPCVIEMPELNEIVEKYKSEEVVF